MCILRHGSGLKVAEDNAAAGRTDIRLFSARGIPALPSAYRINDKSASKCEFVTLTGADGDMYMLDEPLKYSHPRSADVVPVTSVRCSDNGEFFFVLSSEFKRDESGISLVILAQKDDRLFTAEATAAAGGITDAGELKFRKG